MAFCTHCGKALSDGANFCEGCGKAVYQEAPTHEVVPVTVPASEEEQEFLTQTARLLRWERKAWSIAGKAYLIFGIVFAGIMMFFGILASLMAETPAPLVICMVYALFLGGMILAIGIVNRKAADRIVYYQERFDRDFKATYKRCDSVGMIIFCYFFNQVSMVFYIINFVRMKCNKALIRQIIDKQ